MNKIKTKFILIGLIVFSLVAIGFSSVALVKNGIDGLNGKNGIQGDPGRDGLDGKDGENGKDGANGGNGQDGENGKDSDLIYEDIPDRIWGHSNISMPYAGSSSTTAAQRYSTLWFSSANTVSADVKTSEGSGSEQFNAYYVRDPLGTHFIRTELKLHSKDIVVRVDFIIHEYQQGTSYLIDLHYQNLMFRRVVV